MLSGHSVSSEYDIWRQSESVSVKATKKNMDLFEKTFGDDDKGVRLLIVRNPFDRIVSAFRDTLEKVFLQEECSDAFCAARAEMVGLYRKAALQKFGTSYFNSYQREKLIHSSTFKSREGNH